MSSVFWWLNLVRLHSSYKLLYPKRRIESYSILGTIVSPNKILLIRGSYYSLLTTGKTGLAICFFSISRPRFLHLQLVGMRAWVQS